MQSSIADLIFKNIFVLKLRLFPLLSEPFCGNCIANCICVDGMFGSLVYTARLYPGAAVWNNECDNSLLLLLFKVYTTTYSVGV